MAMLARMPMIATTISTSISVNPVAYEGFSFPFHCFGSGVGQLYPPEVQLPPKKREPRGLPFLLQTNYT